VLLGESDRLERGLRIARFAARDERSPEQGGCVRASRVGAQRLKPRQRLPQMLHRLSWLACEQLDHRRVRPRLVQLQREPELLQGRAGSGEDLARSIRPAAHRLEHRLTAQRQRLDMPVPRRHPQNPHDVQTTTARAHDRGRPPQRRTWRSGQHGSGAPAVIDAARCDQRPVQRDLDEPDPAEARVRLRDDGPRLRFAPAVAQLTQLGRGRGDGVSGPHRIVVGRQVREPALDHRHARTADTVLANREAILRHDLGRPVGRTCTEHCLGEIPQDLRLGFALARERTREQILGGRQVLPGERAAPGGQQMFGGADAQRAARASSSGPSSHRYDWACSRWKAITS
jgi:hypothetical protein